MGVRFFVLACAVRNHSELDSLRATLPMPLRVVRLVVPLRVIEERLRSDVTRAREDDLREATAWLAVSDGAGIEDLEISNDRPVRAVASEIVDWLGWVEGGIP